MTSESTSVTLRLFLLLSSVSLTSIQSKLSNVDLIACRSQAKLPEDPQQHLLDYFGNQRSPLWDQIEDMQDENSQMREDMPRLNNQIA